VGAVHRRLDLRLEARRRDAPVPSGLHRGREERTARRCSRPAIGILLAFFDGEPGAEVYAYATKRDQAKIVWNDAVQMVAKNASLSKRIKALALTLLYEQTSSFFKPLGRDSDTDQGINVHAAIIDELHVLEDADAIGNLETAASARRQPIIVKITTAGVKRDSVWARERADAVAVVEGREDDDAMLVLVYTLDEDDDPFDEAVWPKSNPNLGISVKVDFLREQAAVARRSPGKLAAFLRFRMNVPTGVAVKAIDIDEWDACSGLIQAVDEDDHGLDRLETYAEWEARTFRDGAGCYGGLDLASVQDITALVLLFRNDEGMLDVLCRFWIPEESVERRSRIDGTRYDEWVRDGFLITTPGNVTDYAFVRRELLELAERFAIGEIGYDVWNATQLAVELAEEGASVTPIHQTHAALAPPWRELTREILERKIRHGGHPVLRWMAGNVETELDAAGNEKPSKRHSQEKIDGMISLTMARGRWMANGSVATWTAA
jgi:phage terminase large subunit-like protein